MKWEKDLINYRRQKASETLDDARILLERKRFFSAVNRIYYALFYEVSALLKTKNLSSTKHSGVRAFFNEHFVRTGIVPIEVGRFYSRMFDFRQEGDYDDFIYFNEEDVTKWLETATKTIETLEKCIDTQI